MKKTILLILFIFALLISSYSQIKTVNISRSKIGCVFCFYQKAIDLSKSDTTYIVRIMYQNKRKVGVIDSEVINITTQSELKDFCNDLKTALPQICEKANLSWSREGYAISLYESTKALYLFQSPSEGDGYTTFNTKSVKKLLSWLDTIEIGKG